MSDSARQQYRWLNLKRAVFEWATLALVVVSVACLTYWVVTMTSSLADLEPMEPRSRLVLSATNGTFRARSGESWTIEELDAWARGWLGDPPITSDRAFTIPGFRCRILRFGDNDPCWAFELSILYPFVVVATLAAICHYRYRKTLQRIAAGAEPDRVSL